jgi:RNA polymerase sigma-70 factor, ECF subfamily
VTANLDREVVRAAIAQLPLQQRRAIFMAYFEGRSHSEIAEETRLPLGTVKSRIRLGMERLRATLLEAGTGSVLPDMLPMTSPTHGAGPRPAA